jgi:DNA invertase Pin-like site-specific DNA recombinase
MDRAEERAEPEDVGDQALSARCCYWPVARCEAEATKAAQRAGIDHAKQSEERAYLGRKPSFNRDQFNKVRAMLAQGAVGIAQVAKGS